MVVNYETANMTSLKNFYELQYYETFEIKRFKYKDWLIEKFPENVKTPKIILGEAAFIRQIDRIRAINRLRMNHIMDEMGIHEEHIRESFYSFLTD